MVGKQHHIGENEYIDRAETSFVAVKWGARPCPKWVNRGSQRQYRRLPNSLQERTRYYVHL